MKPKRVTIVHPLCDRLRALDKEATQRFPSEFDKGLGRLGLLLHTRPKNGGDFCTPTNTISFAGTGGDGVHFSFVVVDGRVTEDSPIVMTCPAGGDRLNQIVGESLFDFLCLGFHRGYFALEGFPSDDAIDAYSSAEWQPTKSRHRSAGYLLDQHQRNVLDFLIAELGLRPWDDLRQKFETLQESHMPLLDIPAGGENLG